MGDKQKREGLHYQAWFYPEDEWHAEDAFFVELYDRYLKNAEKNRERASFKHFVIEAAKALSEKHGMGILPPPSTNEEMLRFYQARISYLDSALDKIVEFATKLPTFGVQYSDMHNEIRRVNEKREEFNSMERSIGSRYRSEDMADED